MSKILSLNFVKTNLLNPTKFPLLFYWNGENTVIEEMTNNEDFMELVVNKYCTIELYSYTTIYLIEYDIDNDKYEQINIPIQKFLSIENDRLYNLRYKYIEEILLNLYKISMKEEYKLLVESDIDNIVNIYTILKNKYKERINPETLQKYILSQLQQVYQLNNFNCNYIIKTYDEIIS